MAHSALESRIGDPYAGDDSVPGVIRRHYTNNYSMLDRFDRLWYQTKYPIACKSWEVYFSWALLHQAVINAYVAYCKCIDSRIPVLEYLVLVVNEFVRSRTQ